MDQKDTPEPGHRRVCCRSSPDEKADNRSIALVLMHAQTWDGFPPPSETIAIYYDSYENLLAQGVPVSTPTIARYRPDPFPERGRFVPDPR